MYRFIPLAVAAAAALTIATPATATVSVFSATLTGPNESPPNASAGQGLGLVTFDDVALTVAVSELFFNLTGPATGGHIHCCTATPGTGTAPILVPFPTFPAASFGTFNATFTLSSATFSQLLSGTQAGLAYLNIHTAAFSGGEIRGFLSPVSAVPETGTYALMLGGLALVGWSSRKRSRDARAA